MLHYLFLNNKSVRSVFNCNVAVKLRHQPVDAWKTTTGNQYDGQYVELEVNLSPRLSLDDFSEVRWPKLSLSWKEVSEMLDAPFCFLWLPVLIDTDNDWNCSRQEIKSKMCPSSCGRIVISPHSREKLRTTMNADRRHRTKIATSKRHKMTNMTNQGRSKVRRWPIRK